MKHFPIVKLNLNNSTEKVKHDKIIQLVEQMLTINKQLTEASVPQTKTVLKRQIDATDRQIDELVYQLYGLTEKEIEIVEKKVDKFLLR